MPEAKFVQLLVHPYAFPREPGAENQQALLALDADGFIWTWDAPYRDEDENGNPIMIRGCWRRSYLGERVIP